MFPLGSVLFPYMPLQLRVFEERYLVMVSQLLESGAAEFGTVLIERGQEVGGGEQRFSVGTVARIIQLGAGEQFVSLLAQGGRRFEVVEWLDEDPHPRAVVQEIADLEWDDSLTDLLVRAESTVRRALAMASEFAETQWASTVELSDDSVESAWQLAGIAPVGALDQIRLLRSTSLEQLLDSTIELVEEAGESFTIPWPDD